MTSYRDSSGRTIDLGPILSRGGEGFIHEVPTLPDHVAKIWREPSERQARKLEVLLRHAPSLPDHVRARVELAWPSEAIYDEHKVMRGYLMPKVPLDQYHELVRYCIPAARRGLEQERGTAFTRTELLTITRNVAEVFRILHVMGYLIGDVNHTNFLVRGDGKTFVIDLDSIQARDPDTGEVHRCTVGKEDFTPPRLMGQRFEDVDRTPDDDMFGLAVLVFQLLMDGNHPFDPVDQTGEEGQVRQSNIRRAYSPYTAIDPVQARAILDLDMIADTTVRERTRENMLALMGVEATADFSTVIGPRISLWLQVESAFQEMFRRAFEDKGGGRPISSEWVQVLENAGATILRSGGPSPPAPAAPRPAARTPTRLAAQPATPPQAPQPTTPSQTLQTGGWYRSPQVRGQPASSAGAPASTRSTASPASPSTAAQSSSPPVSSRPRPPLQSAAYHTPSSTQGGGRRVAVAVSFLLGIPVLVFGGIFLFGLAHPFFDDIIEGRSPFGNSETAPPPPTAPAPPSPPPTTPPTAVPTLVPAVPVVLLDPTPHPATSVPATLTRPIEIEPVTLSAGDLYTCGLKEDGDAVCWGEDGYGQWSPPDGSFTALSAGDDHTCGLGPDGSAVCWGYDHFGQSSPPDGAFAALSAGDRHTCGLRPDGSAVCWGYDDYGQSSPPDGAFAALSAGDRHTCGLRPDGSTVCWGYDAYGQSSPPDGSFTALSAGDHHTCGLSPDGSAVCWGKDEETLHVTSGGPTHHFQWSPPDGIFAVISAGGDHTCGLRPDGSAVCWGPEGSGKSSPPDGIFAVISAGGDHTCGLRPDGSAVCWGYDVPGEWSPPEDVRLRIPPSAIPTPVPTEVVPPPSESVEVVVKEGDFIKHTFDWDHALHGNADPEIVFQDTANVWTSPVTHLDWEATITIGADDDSFVGDGSAEVLISNDSGTKEYVLNVSVLDAGEGAAMPTVAPTRTPRPTVTPGPTWTPRPAATSRPTTTLTQAAPSAGRIAFASNRNGRWNIYVMNADGSDLTRLADDPANDRGPGWSPDGQRIAFHSDRDLTIYGIYVMNADGSDLTRLTDWSGNSWYPDWSPDGRRIAFYSDREGDGAHDIYVMNADGSGVTRLTDGSGDDGYPDWSPDGQRIAFNSDLDGDSEIYVMNADGSGVNKLTDNSAGDASPSWSPDGRRIAFNSDRDGDSEIYVMSADGSGEIRLTDSSGNDGFPDWSPDGQRIVFHSDRDGGSHNIYAMNADGSDLTRLTDGSAYNWTPDWSPASGQASARTAPTPTPRPTVTPTVTPTFTPVATPTPVPAPLPNLAIFDFDICVEGMGCWPKSDDEAGVSGSRRVSITWVVGNSGNAPTESPTDLRLYADGQHHESEYLMGRDAFVIPVLEPGDGVEVRAMTKKNPDDFWPITFSLVGQNAIIAIVDIEDRVEESNECGNLKRYRDIFSAMQSDCDNVAYVSDLVFLPTPVPTPTPLPTVASN